MFLSRLIWMGSAAACALVVSSASAQPGAQPADEPATAQDESDQPTASNDANEIVVTALRRSQRLQSVPASITAIGGDTLASNHVSSAAELSANVPNLQATSTLGENIPIFSLRGVSMSDFSVNQQSPVATYFDEVYKGSFPFIPIGLYDLERLEVLRGPQGTLYGKNTTGGAVNFISRLPQFENEGYLSLGYGNYNRMDANGALNVALGDTTAARLAFTFARRDGWFKNRVPGEPDLNQVRNYAIRGTIRTKPTPDLELVLRLSTSLDNPFNYGIYGRPLADGIGAGVYELFGMESYFRTGLTRREIETSYARRRRHRTNSAALTANWDLANDIRLTSITSYDRGKLHNPEDTEGSPRQVNDNDIRAKGHQFAQDLRIASSFSAGLNFILGAYYHVEKLDTSTEYRFFTDIDVDGDGNIDADDCAVDFFTACVHRNQFAQKKSSKALYADLTYELGELVTLRGGLRYTWDRGRLSDFKAQAIGIDGVPVANTIPGDPGNFDATTALRFSKGSVTGKVGVDLKLSPDHLLYASYSRGYRGSSFNSQAFFAPDELTIAKPETVDAFEIGAKTQFLDRRLTLNGAVFLYNYKNQQALSLIGVLQPLVNIPKSQIYGAELELVVRPLDVLTLRGGAGYLHTEIRRGNISGADLAGNRLPNAPTWSLNAAADLTILKKGADELSLGINASYNTKQYFDLFNTQRIAQPGYALVNAQASYSFGDGKYKAQIWGKNLFNRTYATSGLDISALGYDYFHLAESRTYGVTVEAKF
jgi:iron complex outermembrane receptor protein